MRSLSAILALTFFVVVVGCAPKEETAITSAPEPAPGNNKISAVESKIKYADVQKIFTEKCVGCHGDTDPKALLKLTSYEGLMSGTGKGPVVKPSDATGSLLVEVLNGVNGKPLMPPKNPLPAEQIRLIEDWIIAGAQKA